MRDAYNGKPTKCHAIVAYVQKHPGCTRRQMLAGIGSDDESDALPAYCRRHGMLFVAGPRGSQRYYPTAELAEAADGAIRAAVIETRRQKRSLNTVAGNLRKRALRIADGAKPMNTRPGQMAVVLAPDAALHPGVKITRAEPFVDRRFAFEPAPGWVGQITQDWRERRLQEAR